MPWPCCGMGSVAVADDETSCPLAVPTCIFGDAVFIRTCGACGAIYRFDARVSAISVYCTTSTACSNKHSGTKNTRRNYQRTSGVIVSNSNAAHTTTRPRHALLGTYHAYLHKYIGSHRPYLRCGLHCHVNFKGRDKKLIKRSLHPHRIEGDIYAKNVTLHTESTQRTHYTGNTKE